MPTGGGGGSVDRKAIDDEWQRRLDAVRRDLEEQLAKALAEIERERQRADEALERLAEETKRANEMLNQLRAKLRNMEQILKQKGLQGKL